MRERERGLLSKRKIREINQPRRRGMEIIILQLSSPSLSLLLHLSLRFRKFAFYIALTQRCQKAFFLSLPLSSSPPLPHLGLSLSPPQAEKPFSSFLPTTSLRDIRLNEEGPQKKKWERRGFFSWR